MRTWGAVPLTYNALFPGFIELNSVTGLLCTPPVIFRNMKKKTYMFNPPLFLNSFVPHSSHLTINIAKGG